MFFFSSYILFVNDLNCLWRFNCIPIAIIYSSMEQQHNREENKEKKNKRQLQLINHFRKKKKEGFFFSIVMCRHTHVDVMQPHRHNHFFFVVVKTIEIRIKSWWCSDSRFMCTKVNDFIICSFFTVIKCYVMGWHSLLAQKEARSYFYFFCASGSTQWKWFFILFEVKKKKETVCFAFFEIKWKLPIMMMFPLNFIFHHFWRLWEMRREEKKKLKIKLKFTFALHSFPFLFFFFCCYRKSHATRDTFVNYIYA